MVGAVIAIIACLFCHWSLAVEGVVVALEAPLLRAAKTDALVVQRFRKGDVVSFPKDQISGDPLFYRTFDRNGRPAYMLKRHVKLITNDERESDWPINSFDPDLTDYRIREPLPAGYPFKRKKKRRGVVVLGPVLTAEQTYQFAHAPRSVEAVSPMQLLLQYTKENPFGPRESERESRFYFGGFVRLIFGGGTLSEFSSGDTAEESAFQLGLGPLVSYDLFRRDKDRLIVTGAIGVNLINSYFVQLNGGDGEGRLFKAEAPDLAPTFSFLYQRQRVLGNLDLMAGLSGNLVFPQELHSEGVTQSGILWENQSSIKRSLFIDWALALGIQYSL